MNKRWPVFSHVKQAIPKATSNICRYLRRLNWFYGCSNCLTFIFIYLFIYLFEPIDLTTSSISSAFPFSEHSPQMRHRFIFRYVAARAVLEIKSSSLDRTVAIFFQLLIIGRIFIFELLCVEHFVGCLDLCSNAQLCTTAHSAPFQRQMQKWSRIESYR